MYPICDILVIRFVQRYREALGIQYLQLILSVLVLPSLLYHPVYFIKNYNNNHSQIRKLTNVPFVQLIQVVRVVLLVQYLHHVHQFLDYQLLL